MMRNATSFVLLILLITLVSACGGGGGGGSSEGNTLPIYGITDTGDNQFDSAVFIDNLVFSGYAKTDILSYKEVDDLNQPPF